MTDVIKQVVARGCGGPVGARPTPATTRREKATTSVHGLATTFAQLADTLVADFDQVGLMGLLARR